MGLNHRPTVYESVIGLRDESTNQHEPRMNTTLNSFYSGFVTFTEKRTDTNAACCNSLQIFRRGFWRGGVGTPNVSPPARSKSL